MPTITTSCAGCGDSFEAKRSTARWCSDRCRKRQRRKTSGEESGTPRRPSPDEPADSGLVDSVLRELEEADVAGSFAGQLALQLARKMTAVDATGVAGLSKELRQVMADALGTTSREPADCEDEPDPLEAALDEVARKRANRDSG